MQLYLAVTPDKLSQAQRYTGNLAHVAYRVGRDGYLVGRSLPTGVRGGLMVLGDRDAGTIRAPEDLARQILRIRASRGFSGVVADFEGPATADRLALLQALSPLSRQLYVPERYGLQAPQATVLICTALSGGVFRQKLEEAGARFGPRLALDLQRLRMDFPVPCPTGEGRPLTGKELENRLEGRGVFYSADLCAKYATYAEKGQRRFLLFDDGATLSRKLRLGQELGIATALVMYPEVEDLLPELFRRR